MTIQVDARRSNMSRRYATHTFNQEHSEEETAPASSENEKKKIEKNSLAYRDLSADRYHRRGGTTDRSWYTWLSRGRRLTINRALIHPYHARVRDRGFCQPRDNRFAITSSRSTHQSHVCPPSPRRSSLGLVSAQRVARK